MKKVLIILGPTAVGKTELAVNLAKKFNGEVISADSVQIYKGLDIGSAKITKEEMQGIEHHFIDILPPDSEFSVFEFVKQTKSKIDDIISRDKLPIIAGGTGLYIRALLNGYDFGGTGKMTEYRKELQERAEKDLGSLYEELVTKNPDAKEKIKPGDEKRIIRGLEILKFGETPTQSESDLDALVIVLSMDRQKLYERINERSEIMLKKGLIEEVKGLLDMGLSGENQSMKAIGYKEVISYIKGEIDEEKLKEILKQHTRNYAKRQMTFFRSLKEAHFVDMDDRNEGRREIDKLIEEWL